MDKEILEDYEAKELEYISKWSEKIKNGELGPNDRIPSSDRLRLIEPYTNSISGEKIWNQIPLYGSIVIRIAPISNKENFEYKHGFKIEDINRLIEFSRETGKVQFVLTTYPTVYENIEFLDPILQLQPPLVFTVNPAAIDLPGAKQWMEEFLYLSDITGFLDYVIPLAESVYGRGNAGTWIGRYAGHYAILRLLGKQIDQKYDKIADEILLQFSTDHQRAYLLLIGSGNLLTGRYIETMRGIHSVKTTIMHDFTSSLGIDNNLITEKIEFPCDVGKFLNEKLKLIVPKNIEGSIELNDEYELYDLRKIMYALHTAVREEKIDIITAKTNEIQDVFEHVWNDVDKLKKKANITRHGISLGIGVIGAITTLPIGGVGGLLASLGFEVGETITDIKGGEVISEKMVKWMVPNHMIHIYDYKKKYKLL